MSLSHPQIQWPEGKKFAFTIFDDTDAATVANTSPVYALLRDLGFRTTKSVWPLAETEPAVAVGGANCAEDAYRAWALQLQAEVFETGFASHDLSGDHLWQKKRLQRPPRSRSVLLGNLCKERITYVRNSPISREPT